MSEYKKKEVPSRRAAYRDMYLDAISTQPGAKPHEVVPLVLALDVPTSASYALELRYGSRDGYVHTWREIGERLGVSQTRARQLAAKGLRILGRRIKERMQK